MSLELICKIHETNILNCESEIQCTQSAVVRVVNVITSVLWRDVSVRPRPPLVSMLPDYAELDTHTHTRSLARTHALTRIHTC
jgi:hypothetical protein